MIQEQLSSQWAVSQGLRGVGGPHAPGATCTHVAFEKPANYDFHGTEYPFNLPVIH